MADIKLKMSTNFASIKYVINRFPNLCDASHFDLLEMEYAKYKAEKLGSDIMECDRIDVAWHKISLLPNLDMEAKNIKFYLKYCLLY